jgi:hypothetical protein
MVGRMKGWKIEGDRKRYVDMEEIKKLREPKPLPPRLAKWEKRKRLDRGSSWTDGCTRVSAGRQATLRVGV